MAFTRVRNSVSTPNNSPYTNAMPSNDQGNVIIFAIITNNNAVPNTPTDSSGNIYELAVGPFGNTTSGFGTIWIAFNIAARATTNTISVTFTGGPGGGETVAAEYNPGVNVIASLETNGTATGAGTGNAPLTGTYSSSLSDDLMFCWLCLASTLTETPGSTGNPGNWSALPAPSPPDAFTGVEDSLSNSPSSTNTGRWSLSNNGTWTILAIAIKGTPTVPPGTSFPVRHPIY